MTVNISCILIFLTPSPLANIGVSFHISCFFSFSHRFFYILFYRVSQKKVWFAAPGAISFWGIGVPNKITNFQKILKNPYSGEFHKEGSILHQAPQITLFLTHPVYIWYMFGSENRELMSSSNVLFLANQRNTR